MINKLNIEEKQMNNKLNNEKYDIQHFMNWVEKHKEEIIKNPIGEVYDFDKIFDSPIEHHRKGLYVFSDENLGVNSEILIKEFSKRSGLNEDCVRRITFVNGNYYPFQISDLDLPHPLPIYFNSSDVSDRGITFNNLINRFSRYCDDTRSNTECIKKIKEPFTTLKDHFNYVWDRNIKENKILREKGDYLNLGRKQQPQQILLWLGFNHTKLSDKDFSELFRKGWIMFPHSFRFQHHILSLLRQRKLFSKDFSLTNYLEDIDKVIYDKLPNKVKVYRGINTNEKPIMDDCGMSWTISEERGMWFGKDEDVIGWLISGWVDKKDIICVYNQRLEYEVVINPRKVRNKKLQSLNTLNYKKFMKGWNKEKKINEVMNSLFV